MSFYRVPVDSFVFLNFEPQTHTNGSTRDSVAQKRRSCCCCCVVVVDGAVAVATDENVILKYIG